MNIFDFIFRGKDEVSPVSDKINKKMRGDILKTQQQFKNVFENVAQNATGSFGSIAGGLFKLPGPAGIAAASILAIGGAAFTAAKKYAEASAANNIESAKFLASLDKLKGSFSGLVNTVGNAAVGAFNSLAAAFGLAATSQETLLRQQKAYDELIVKQVADTDAYVKKLGELLDANDRLDEVGRIRDYFDAFSKGNTELANAYAKNILLLKTQQIFEKGLADAQKNNRDKPKAQLESEVQKKGLSEVEAARKAFLEGRALREKALAENQARRDEIEKAFIENNALARRQADEQALEALNRQREAALRVGEAIRAGIVNTLENAIFAAKDLNSFLENILQSFLRAGIGFALNALTGGIGGALGGIFGSSAKLAGGNTPIPVSGRPAPAAVATPTRAQAGSAISLNFTSPVIDINFVRNRLVPMLRELNRNGISIA